MLLSTVGLTAVSQYRTLREKEVSPQTCNMELGFVRYLLNRAAEDSKLEVAPRRKIPKVEGKHNKAIADQGYQSIMAAGRRMSADTSSVCVKPA